VFGNGALSRKFGTERVRGRGEREGEREKERERT
jgi:hypothetical protein